jgi:hypothetical protein
MPTHNRDTPTETSRDIRYHRALKNNMFVIPILLNTKSSLSERGGYMYSLAIYLAQSKLQTGKTTLTPMYSR